MVGLVSLTWPHICFSWQGPANGNMAHLCILRPLAQDYTGTMKHLPLPTYELWVTDINILWCVRERFMAFNGSYGQTPGSDGCPGSWQLSLGLTCGFSHVMFQHFPSTSQSALARGSWHENVTLMNERPPCWHDCAQSGPGALTMRERSETSFYIHFHIAITKQ